MKKIILLIFGIVLLQACQDSQDAAFEIFKKDFQDKARVVFVPKNEMAVPTYFSPIPLLEKDSMGDARAFYEEQASAVQLFEVQKLNKSNQALLMIVEEWISQNVNDLNEGKKDIPHFALLAQLRQEEQDSTQSNEEQFSKINQRLTEIPLYFEQIKKHLKSPTEEKLKSAIDECAATYFYLKDELPLRIRKPDILKEAQIDFSEKNRKAQLAVKDFIAFLGSWVFELGDGE